MNIGKRIRQLRLSKLMTQADLAGDQITRNMLCNIERGTALPSLPTAMYLAGRLGVPVGLLLAEEGGEFPYRKMIEMPNIRRAFAAGDFTGCLSLLHSSFPAERDDELSLLCAEAEFGAARNAFEEGRFRRAAAAFDRGVTAAGQTVYDTDSLRARTAVYFRYLSGVSPLLLVSNGSVALYRSAGADEVAGARAFGDEFCEYFMALDALENGRDGEVAAYLTRQEKSLYAARIRALILMKKEEYQEAEEALEALLARPELSVGALLYEIFGDLDLCCRKNDDYKRAYEFAGSRMGLLERLLEES